MGISNALRGRLSGLWLGFVSDSERITRDGRKLYHRACPMS